MSAGQARKDAEALRYRSIVRLALVSREAKAQGRGEVVTAAEMLRQEIEAIAIDEATAEPAKQAVLAAVPKLEKVQREMGLPDHGMAVYPKWLRFAAWTSPVLISVGALAWIIERRRKKREITSAEIERLEHTQS